MRTAWKKIRYHLEWLALKSATKVLPLLSRKACYRLALLLGSLGAYYELDKWIDHEAGGGEKYLVCAKANR